MVGANTVNGVRGALGAQYLGSIVGALAAEARAEAGLPPPAGAQAGASLLYRYNPALEYKVFMVPGLIAVLITLLCCALTALNIVGEKEAGTIEQINVSPVPRRLLHTGQAHAQLGHRAGGPGLRHDASPGPCTA